MAEPSEHWDDGGLNVGQEDSPPQRGRLSAEAGEAASRDGEDVRRRRGDLSPGGPVRRRSVEDAGLEPPDSAETDSRAPEITEDKLLETDEIWNALTGSFNHNAPLEWEQNCSVCISTFNLEENPRKAAFLAELSGEEELQEQLDTRSIIAPCLSEEPLMTAEQVIEEIEEMMQDLSEHNPSQSDFSTLPLEVQRCSPGFEERLRASSVSELMWCLEETKRNTQRFSEELVQQLAMRDELGFEKEVKNCFISALIDVQNRQKEHREALRRKKKLKGGTAQGPSERTSRFSMEGLSSVIQNSFKQTFGSGCSERQYLTTVIPYEGKGHPPSVEDLQVLTKILQAMRDDSDKVPSLLTNYILNVLCPT
ncbi:fasciculation and elongation protein zeta-2 isoform X1 [Oryzias latipes]|uniref:Fasciculation and elongation protein zeta 2a n=1 Tax=Oryzias latipes TaxID=8090 RepID=H2LI89_ORYLA|nr:fasciculation and elongation protein zeta-2 isoform X1 [Oryzias latipes]